MAIIGRPDDFPPNGARAGKCLVLNRAKSPSETYVVDLGVDATGLRPSGRMYLSEGAARDIGSAIGMASVEAVVRYEERITMLEKDLAVEVTRYEKADAALAYMEGVRDDAVAQFQESEKLAKEQAERIIELEAELAEATKPKPRTRKAPAKKASAK